MSLLFEYIYLFILTCTHTLAHSRSQNKPPTLTHSYSPTHTLHTHSLILAYTHRHTHSAPCSVRGRRGIMCTVKGRIFPPGVPRAPPFLPGRRGIIFIAKGWDACRGVPGAPHFLRGRYRTINLYCQGVGFTPWRGSGSGRIYTVPGSEVPSGVPRALLLLCGRRGSIKFAKTRIFYSGVPRAPLLLRGSRRSTHSLADFFTCAHRHTLSDLHIH